MQQEGTITRIRRTFAAILLALISATFLVPLASATDDPDVSLPVCCRAHGAHRCSLKSTHMRAAPESNQADRDATPVFSRASDRGAFPTSYPAPIHGDGPDLATALYGSFNLSARLFLHPWMEARRLLTYDRSHQKRGPPAHLLSA